MEISKWYQFRLFLIRFFIIGMMSYIVEIYFTGTISFIESIHKLITCPNYVFDIGKATEGHTGILAFFIYCWAAIPFTFLNNPLKSIIKDNLLIPKLGVIIRGVIYGLIFLFIEFIGGIFMLIVFNYRAWDYSNIPFNVCGVITFSFLPAWTLAGIIGEWFHERLLQIDDILANPQGFNNESVQTGLKRYETQKALKKTKK